MEKHIAACVNILGSAQSIYYWNDKLYEEEETVLIAKTKKELSSTLIEKVKEIHSYECPCIVELPILGGNKEYLRWIDMLPQSK